MGPVTRRALDVAPGLVACAGAFLLQTSPASVVAGALLYALGATPWRRIAGISLLAAPVLLAAGAPAAGVLDVATWAWVLLAIAATVPLFLRLGGRIPWRGAVPMALALLAVAVPLGLPWAPTFLTSDVAIRAQIVLLGAGTLIALGSRRLLQGRVQTG